jgi:hypothetical protein
MKGILECKILLSAQNYKNNPLENYCCLCDFVFFKGNKKFRMACLSYNKKILMIRNGRAGTLYLTEAPITGVVMPTSANKTNTNSNENMIIFKVS